MPGPRSAASVLVGVALALAAGACRGHDHDVTGLVLKVDVDAGRGVVTVSHEPIPGLMDAMVMPFNAADPSELRGVKPGDRVAFRLRVGTTASRIDRVRILSAAPAESSLDTAAAPAIPIGAAVPDVTLTDHRGAPVSLSGLRGRIVVVSFIYTRCPLPDFCPRVMTNFTVLRDRFRDRLGKDVVLLTISFDPRHDTPDTLKTFADQYGADVDGWHLLTGPMDEVARICAALGVQFYPDEGMITHSLQTAIIDRGGRLAATAEGREFSTRQLGDLVEHVLNSGGPV